jgi:hypothetical protein
MLAAGQVAVLAMVVLVVVVILLCQQVKVPQEQQTLVAGAGVDFQAVQLAVLA